MLAGAATGGSGILAGTGRLGVTDWVIAATGTGATVTGLCRCIKNSPVPNPMNTTAAPAMNSGVFPRYLLDGVPGIASGESENSPRMSLDEDGLMEGEGVVSHDPESEVKSEAAPAAFAGT